MAVRDVVQAAAGVGGGGEYVEDVFSTYLYTGNGSARSINNGIDLDGEGGLVWTKSRDSGGNYFTDTERGAGHLIASPSTDAEAFTADTQKTVTGFNSDGYSLGTDTGNWGHNFNSSYDYASWTFRKAPKFFDVVTFTGTAATQNIAHNLGSVPGMIIVKSTTAAGGWAVWHNSLSSSTNHWLRLDWTNGEINQTDFWPSAPTDSQFTVGGYAANNAENQTLVAYLFAHDAGGFGDDGLQNVISCGSFTASGGTASVTLGFEPQLLMFKRSDGSGNWAIYDDMRGMPNGSNKYYLAPNSSGSETSFGNTDPFEVNATGFEVDNSYALPGGSNGAETYIYIAIRRGPMKTPESGTEVFAVDYGGNSPLSFVSGFPVDMAILGRTGSTYPKFNWGRLFGDRLDTSSADAQATGSSAFPLDSNTQTGNGWGAADIAWMFKRAPSVFDVVAYTGTGVARAVPHNLGVAPEMMIVKPRDSTGGEWKVYSNALSIQSYLRLNLDEAFVNFGAPGPWNNTAPTDSAFNVSVSGWSTNDTGRTYIAYLFATLAGVSKVGSYTGTGADLNVDCGFSAGARFILIKRTDSTSDWYVWDSARGIAAGNDPYLLLNSTAAEVTNTDYIDPLSSGFTVTSNASSTVNVNTGTYIFLAIA